MYLQIEYYFVNAAHTVFMSKRDEDIRRVLPDRNLRTEFADVFIDNPDIFRDTILNNSGIHSMSNPVMLMDGIETIVHIKEMN